MYSEAVAIDGEVEGLRTRRDRPLSPQTFGNMLRNRIYIGHMESPEIAVSARGDFEPLIDEAIFYRAQAVPDGRVPVAAPRQRSHPDFPLRGFVLAKPADAPSPAVGRRGVTALRVLPLPAPLPGRQHEQGRTRRRLCGRTGTAAANAAYMRVVKGRVLYVWEQECAAARDRTELGVEGILAFAERILPRAADLWVQASLDCRQRLQELFFPEGIAFDGNRSNRTAVTAPLFR